MMGNSGFQKRYTRFLVLFFLALFIAAGVPGCSGGGDEDDFECSVFIVLDLYQYFFNNSFIGQGAGLSADFDGNTVKIAPFWLSGTFHTVTGELTVDDSSRYDITDVSMSLFGDFDVDVTNTLTFPGDGDPTAGAYEVDTISDTTTVLVNSPADGVLVTLEDGQQVFYSWDDFDMDNPGAPQHVQRASFALGGLGFMLEQLAFTVEALQFVGENEPVFAGQGTVRDFCDAFADFPGITNNPGFLDITWRDNGDGFLSFGDDFDALFTECWEDDPGDAEDELLDGTVFFNDYYEAIDGNCRVVGAGFDDVQYDDLDIAETQSNQPSGGTVAVDSMATVNGRFALFFSQP
jgi:hypothetical protein